MLQGQRVFFIAAAAVMLFLIPYLYRKIPSSKHFFYLRVIAVMYLSGALGNAVDRIVNGYVIDFFIFHSLIFLFLIWPIFMCQ